MPIEKPIEKPSEKPAEKPAEDFDATLFGDDINLSYKYTLY